MKKSTKGSCLRFACLFRAGRSHDFYLSLHRLKLGIAGVYFPPFLASPTDHEENYVTRWRERRDMPERVKEKILGKNAERFFRL